MHRKPNTKAAMRQLIKQIRQGIPFNLTDQEMCLDSCQGCSSKLLIYLESELDEWEMKLAHGDVPNFGDLDSLAKKSKKIALILQQNGLLD